MFKKGCPKSSPKISTNTLRFNRNKKPKAIYLDIQEQNKVYFSISLITLHFKVYYNLKEYYTVESKHIIW